MIQIMLLWLLSVNFVSKFILIVVYCADLCNHLKKIMALVAQFNTGTEICSVRLKPDKAGAILVKFLSPGRQTAK